MTRPWKDGDWLRARGRFRLYYDEWVLFGGAYSEELVELHHPSKGPRTWKKKLAEQVYALANTALSKYTKDGHRPVPDWLTCGIKLSRMFPKLSGSYEVYRVVEIRDRWVLLFQCDPSPKREVFCIVHMRDLRLGYTPHLNRFQRELDL